MSGIRLNAEITLHPNTSNPNMIGTSQLPDVGSRSRTASMAFGNREAHAKRMLASRENEWTHTKSLRIFCGTWNVNDQKVDGDIFPWLATCAENQPDVVALGFQELDLSKEAFIFTDSNRERDCLQACETALLQFRPLVIYKQLKVIRLVGIMLAVFVKEELLKLVHDVAASTVPTGIMGMLGNKGGVAVRFGIHLTTLCFVNSHLAAHPEELDRRNQDFKDISQRMIFSVGVEGNEFAIGNHDIVFWMGDLNYRLHNIEIPSVKELLTRKDYTKLIDCDQLKQQMSVGRVFADFKEQPLTFHPTYKFDVGTDVYDTSDKGRCPAWTDRVLYYTNIAGVRKNQVRPLSYSSHMELRMSDHKPVSALFDVDTRVKDDSAYRKVLEDVMKELDRDENEHLPAVKVDCLELSFGDVKFLETQDREIRLHNIGQVMADYSFVTKPNETSYCRDWLKVHPDSACLLPNESMSIRFEVFVDARTAGRLNVGDDSISDILILHLEGGKDFFISVSGSYVPSCFGTSLATLVTLADPVRNVPYEELQQKERSAAQAAANGDRPDVHDSCSASVSLADFLGSGPAAASEDVMPIPKELYYLCNFIQRRGEEAEDLYQQRGLHKEVLAIRESLDTTLSAELPGSVHSVSEALLNFLEALPEPVVPHRFYAQALASVFNGRHEEVIEKLPLVHRNTFDYLVALMQHLLKFSATNNLDMDKLTDVFGAVMLRSPHQGLVLPSSAARPSRSRNKPNTYVHSDGSRLAASFLKAFMLGGLP